MKTVKHIIDDKEFVSTYKIVAREGRNGIALHCVEVDHANIKGVVIASNAISCHESPDSAWSAYNNAIKSCSWGSM